MRRWHSSNIRLQVAPGEFAAVVGSSGCGKSTLLSLISGLLRPSSGRVTLEGKRVTAPSPRVGYMFQRDTLLEWRAVAGERAVGRRGARARQDEATQARRSDCSAYGLGEFIHALPNQLSGGMRQRAALARTLCPEPEILLLDEPFSALDFQTRLALSDEISGKLRGEGRP